MTRSAAIDYADFVNEFEWTRSRHGGCIEVAALVFGVSSQAMEQRLYRARRAGFGVCFHHMEAAS